MIVPQPRTFTAGELETAAYLNSSITAVGNFILGKPVAQAITTLTTQSFAIGTAAAVTFASSPINRDNNWVVGSPTRLTINTAGWYWLSGELYWANTAATVRGTYLNVNGTTAVNGSNCVTSVASVYFSSISNGFVYLNVGDYVELFGRANGTATTPANPASILGSGSAVTASLTAIWVSS